MSEGSTSSRRLSLSDLGQLSHLLHLIYLRNKNQHRRSHWWRHFNTFRRHLSLLKDEIVPVEAPEQPKSAEALHPPGNLIVEVSKLSPRTQRRLQLWAESYVSKWYNAFTQLLTERRFASMAVVLLAILGRVCWLLKLTQSPAENVGSDMKARLEEFASIELDPSLTAGDGSGLVDSTIDEMVVDTGVIIAREDFPNLSSQPRKPQYSPTTSFEDRKLRDVGRERQVKKTRRKAKANPIDSLFDSLP